MAIIAPGMKGGARVGEEIRGYRLDHLIAEGGMGAVWSATHTSLGRKAAVKLLAPSLATNREYVSRFLSEAKIVNDVRHPNIVDIFDFVEIESPRRVACIMELLEGPTLAARIRQQALPAVHAVRITLQLVDALVQVHEAGVVHRDLKPQNIIVVAPPDSDFAEVPAVKILDFGIAKGGTSAAHKTQTGAVLGTPVYMAPEQVAGGEVSGATDLYALAEMLFEMVTGQRLFTGDNLVVLKRKVMGEVPPLVIPASVPGHDSLAALLRPCLALEPDQRPSMEDFGAALGLMLEQWTHAGLDEPTLPESKPARFDTDETLPSAGAELAGDADTFPSAPGPGAAAVPAPLEGLAEEPVANTQMFYERILEDIDEVRPAPVAPAPEAEPEPEPDLELGTKRGDHAYGVAAPTTDRPTPSGFRIAEERRRAPAAPIPVVRGKKTTEATGRRSWIAVVVALGLLVGVAGVVLWPRMRNEAQARMDLLAASGVQAAAAEWKAGFAPFTGSRDDFLAKAAKAQAEDTPQGYLRAREALRKALILDTESDVALAQYIENEALGFGPELSPSARGELLGWLEDLPRGEGPARRSRALLTVDRARRGALAKDLLRSPAVPDRLVGAELLANEDPEGALAGLEGDDLPPRAVRVRARAHAAQGAFAPALRELAERRRGEPDNRLLLVQEAQVLESIGHLRPAEKHLHKARAADPEHLPTALAHGRVAAARGRVAEAAESLRRVATAEAGPASLRAEAYTRWAFLALEQKAWPVAQERALAALALDPGRARATLALAEAHVQKGEPLAAEEALGRGLEANPKQASLLVARAALHLNRGDGEAAKAPLEAARAEAPHDPRLAAIAAVLSHGAGAQDRAEVHAQHLFALDPLHAQHHDAEIRILPSTRLIANETLRRDDRPRARALQAILQYLFEGPEAARASMRTVSKSPLGALYGAQLELDRGRSGAARRLLEAVPKSSPTRHLLAGRVAARRNATTEAKAAFAEAAATRALTRPAHVEAAALGGREPMQAAFREHQDDPWLRAQLAR